MAAGLASRCEVSLGYVIGQADPICLGLETFGTGRGDEAALVKIVRRHFPLRPADIITELKLRRPIYRATATYGHFGRSGPGFTWERLDKVPALKRYVR